MRCDDAIQAIQEVLTGAGTPMELARRLPDRVQRHLEGCPECREAAHELLDLDRELAGLAEEVPVPTALLASVMAAVRAVPAGGGELALERPELGVSPGPTGRPWGQAAAAVLLAVFGVTWFSSDIMQMWEEWGGVGWLQLALADWSSPDWLAVGETVGGWLDATRDGIGQISLGVVQGVPPALAVVAALAVLAAAMAFSVRLCGRQRTAVMS